MRGFTTKALLLLSSKSFFTSSSRSHKDLYVEGITNLLHYLQEMGVAADCLVTDSLALHLALDGITWRATGALEDLFFMQRYGGIKEVTSKPLAPAVVTSLRKKHPIQTGLDPVQRAEVVAKRVRYAERAIIKEYTFVVVVGKGFHVKGREADGKAIMRVNERTLVPELELSGAPVPINLFLQVPYANQSLIEWSKYHGKY